MLGEDILSALGTGRSPWAAASESPVCQPLDTVDWEESDEGARRSRMALAFWKRQLGRVGDHLDIGSPGDCRDETAAGSIGSGVHQMMPVRLRGAAERASARFSVSVDTVFLTAFGWALASFNDTAVAGVLGMHLNRLPPAEMRSAALRFTHAPLVVERPARGSIGS